MRGRAAILVLPLVLAACGTFRLGPLTAAPEGKTRQQVQLDNLVCKDKARTEAESAGIQVGEFLLGFTIIGTPVAYAHDRDVQRRVWQKCMRDDGYTVTPPLPNEM